MTLQQATTAVTSADSGEREGGKERLSRLIGGGWIFLLLIGLVAVFSILRPAQFGSSYNLTMLAVNAAILLVLSVGQTFVITAAGIDLSVGSVLALTTMAAAANRAFLINSISPVFGGQ